MEQMARNLTDPFDGSLREAVRNVVMVRDSKFTTSFHAILRSAELNPVLLRPRSPNSNAYFERYFRSLKEEALSMMVFLSETRSGNT